MDMRHSEASVHSLRFNDGPGTKHQSLQIQESSSQHHYDFVISPPTHLDANIFKHPRSILYLVFHSNQSQ